MQRGRERLDRLRADRAVGGAQVDQIRGVADDARRPGSAPAGVAKASHTSGLGSGCFHMRGLCVKICSAVACSPAPGPRRCRARRRWRDGLRSASRHRTGVVSCARDPSRPASACHPAPPGCCTSVARARCSTTGFSPAAATARVVLRFEDTDTERSTDAAVDQALRVFDWLGIDWDAGPFRQTERLDLYSRGRRRARGRRTRLPLLLHRRGARGGASAAARGESAADLRRPLPRSHGRRTRRVRGGGP